jgi:hypothetical protein
LDTVRLSWHIRRRFSEKQLFTVYVNRAYFGSRATGVEAVCLLKTLSVENAFETGDIQEEQTEAVPKSGSASNNVTFGSRPVNGVFASPI